jgi:hypothetical protein
LTPAAYALADKYPLAATLLFRAMIDFSLSERKSTRYRHAARNLAECKSLQATIDGFGDFKAHDSYVAQLRERHGRKSSFWNLVA